MDKVFQYLEKLDDKIILKIDPDPDVELYIREAMGERLIAKLMFGSKSKFDQYTTSHRFHFGSRWVFLKCRWTEKKESLSMLSLKRLTLDEYLDYLLELREADKRPLGNGRGEIK